MTKPFSFNTDYEGEEFATFLNISDDAIALHGEQLVYIQQTLAQSEPIFGEYLGKVINEGADVILYVEEAHTFSDDMAGMYSKFGFSPNLGEATFHGTIQYFDTFNIVPHAQDLIWWPKTKKIYEVTHVTEEKKQYKLTAELYNYSHDKIADDVTDTEINSLTDINDDEVINYNDEIEQAVDDDEIIPDDDLGDGLF